MCHEAANAVRVSGVGGSRWQCSPSTQGTKLRSGQPGLGERGDGQAVAVLQRLLSP